MCITASVLIISLFAYNTSIFISIHENLHCFGASAIGRECFINYNETSINKVIEKGETLNSFIYSGMPYIVFLITALLLFLFKKELIKINFLRELTYTLIFLLIFEFIINLSSPSFKGNDFMNIFSIGTQIDIIAIVLVILLFFICSFSLCRIIFKKHIDISENFLNNQI